MKIIQEVHKTFDNEDNKKERQVTVLSHENNFIVIKADSDKHWSDEVTNTVKAYPFNDEKKAQMWVDKLCRDEYL